MASVAGRRSNRTRLRLARKHASDVDEPNSTPTELASGSLGDINRPRLWLARTELAERTRQGGVPNLRATWTGLTQTGPGWCLDLAARGFPYSSGFMRVPDGPRRMCHERAGGELGSHLRAGRVNRARLRLAHDARDASAPSFRSTWELRTELAFGFLGD